MNYPSDLHETDAMARVSHFVRSLQIGRNGEFRMCPGGDVTLYASCFAAMTLHYLGELSQFSQNTRHQWANYILQWQNQADGYFLGPELVKEEITSAKHDWDVVRMHLAVHVLPALDLLEAKPRYPLAFAHRFLDPKYLQEWLEARDWQRAWLEGNNLLFVGQSLVHLRDVECLPGARASLALFFRWLDEHVDPATGLWGTDGGFSHPAPAMYGAYHQLLVYFCENRPIPYPRQLIDSTLAVQEFDGGFSASGGGGACEDVDAISILVNLYQRLDYERPQIRRALRKALQSVLRRLAPEGGFVYRWQEPFTHMSIPRTRVPADTPHLFATWFGVHTLALLAQVLTDEPKLERDWHFNPVLSMGWHRPWDRSQHLLSKEDRQAESKMTYVGGDLDRLRRVVVRKLRSAGHRVVRMGKNAARSAFE
jgi:hypothetical protein